VAFNILFFLIMDFNILTFIKKKGCNLLLLVIIIILNNGCMKRECLSEEKVGLTKIVNDQLSYILPSPKTEGKVTVEEAILKRRSHRSFIKAAISAEDLSQILWSAYGITEPLDGYPQTRGGLRTSPSAGAVYPLELYVLVRKVKDIEPGVYKYISQSHKIVRVINKDMKNELSNAALNQEMIRVVPACLFYTAVFSRSTQSYGDRGRERYVYMELGHSAQNVYLQAEALHLGTCAIGAFNDAEVKDVMQLPEDEEPLYIMPIGRYYYRSEF
jgi:SagB-type dehydrogenase family enzyme